MIRQVDVEYRRPGKPPQRFQEWLVLDRPDAKVLLMDPYPGPELRVDGTLIQSSGAPIVWFVFPSKWHDIGRFHLEDGSCTGWYTNLIQPVEFAGDHWVARDLYLDLWQAVDGDARWLDEDEFTTAYANGLIDDLTRRRVLNERNMIDGQRRKSAWPPAIARDVSLDLARALKAEG